MQAVTTTFDALALTSLLLFIGVWCYTLYGYKFFWKHYDGGVNCETLLRCYKTGFDMTFKNGGSLGGYLVDPD